MMRIIPALLALGLPLPAAAQSLSGLARAVDGDTLDMAGERIRLFGIDAPESAQSCTRRGVRWACGSDATALLAGRIAGRTVECVQRDRDRYGRIVASCRVGGYDLGELMVREGLAIAFTRYSNDYVEAEARARSFGLALWGSQFQTPAEFRAANPARFKPASLRPAVRTAHVRAASIPSPRPASLANIVFRNCAAARAAGAAPLYRGQPSYRPQMDADSDGVACEG